VAALLAALGPAAAATSEADGHHHHHRRHHRSWRGGARHGSHLRHRASLASEESQVSSRAASSAEVQEALRAVDELIAEESRDSEAPQATQPAAAAEPATAAAAPDPKAELFPKAHHLLSREMDGMSDSLRELKDKKSQTDEGHDKLETAQQEAMARMMQGNKMKHLMHQRETNMKVLERRLRRLEGENERIRAEHDRVVVRLHAVMGPRIKSMERRTHRRKVALAKADEGIKGWASLRDKYKASALLKMSERDGDLERWKEAQAAEAKAIEEERAAHDTFDEMKRATNHDVAAFQYANTKFDAWSSKGQERRERAEKEQASVQRMQHILKMEEKQLDASLSIGEERLQRRVAKAKAARDQAMAVLRATKARYAEWQSEERTREEQAAKLKAGFHVAEREFATKRAEVLQNASAAAFEREAATSDYSPGDDWAWESNPEEDSVNVGE